MYQLLRKRLAGKKGFTLIELIVVIAVIAILAVILIPRFVGFTQSAREKSVMSDARNVLMALEALDTEGKLTYDATDTTKVLGVKDESSLVKGINNYLGKTVLYTNATLDDGQSMIVGDVTRTDDGFTFLLNKNVGGTTYYAKVTGSNIVAGEGDTPPAS